MEAAEDGQPDSPASAPSPHQGSGGSTWLQRRLFDRLHPPLSSEQPAAQQADQSSAEGITPTTSEPKTHLPPAGQPERQCGDCGTLRRSSVPWHRNPETKQGCLCSACYQRARRRIKKKLQEPELQQVGEAEGDGVLRLSALSAGPANCLRSVLSYLKRLLPNCPATAAM